MNMPPYERYSKEVRNYDKILEEPDLALVLGGQGEDQGLERKETYRL